MATIVAGLLTPALSPEEATAQTGSKNVVVIMVDDLDQGSLDTARAQGLMPNLASYLYNGNKATVFSNSFVSYSVCCPSRATFLTGLYAHNHGVKGNDPPLGGCELFNESSNLATWLQPPPAGYVTGVVGKWLNGYGTSNSAPITSCLNPLHKPSVGWNDWQVLTGNAQRMYNYQINDNGTLVDYGGTVQDYQTNVLRERAVDFIEEATPPFFLYATPTAPHREAGVPEHCTDNFGPTTTIRPFPAFDGDADNIALPQPPSFNEEDVTDKPQHIQDIDRMNDIICTQDVYRDRLESLKSVDLLIGAIATAAAQKAGETVMFFTSDNGFFLGEHRLQQKILPYEESIRVPLLVRDPSTPARREVSDFVVNTDLAATIADLAGIDTSNMFLDGQSFEPFLQGQTPAWRKRFLVEHWAGGSEGVTYPTFLGIRTADTKELYVEYDNPQLEREYYSNVDPLHPGRYQLTSTDDTCTTRCDDLADRLHLLQTCGRLLPTQTPCQDLENAP